MSQIGDYNMSRIFVNKFLADQIGYKVPFKGFWYSEFKCWRNESSNIKMKDEGYVDLDESKDKIPSRIELWTGIFNFGLILRSLKLELEL